MIETKSQIKHPLAKKSMVVSVVVFFAGVGAEIVHHTDVGQWLWGAGLVGFIACALISYDKSQPRYTLPQAKVARGNKVAASLVAALFISVICVYNWQSYENGKTVQAFLRTHPNCHQSADSLLNYLSGYSKEVNFANLAIAEDDLTDGKRSFQVAVTSSAAQPQNETQGLETYLPISIVSSGIEHNGLSADYCVASFEWEGTRYTVEKRQNIWPFACDVLQTNRSYFARWSSEDHSEFSIGELDPSIASGQNWPNPIRERHLTNLATYNVRRWSDSK
jgi:hypothetical protein